VGSAAAPEVSLGVVGAERAFDGILVSWNPLAMAQDRANARAALGLGLRETIHTRAMQASGAGPLEWLDLPPGRSSEEVLQQLARRPGVSFAEPNWLLQSEVSSNDPGVTNGSLWGMYGESSSPANAYGSQAAEAWSRGYSGSDSVVVGIIDEGYQNTHPDLVGNAATNPGEIAANGIDDDGNGYIDDLYGWDFDGNNASIYDGTGDDHGTHVAGTIGGQGGNGIGVAGVNWNVSLLSGKFLGANGGSTANAIKAVDYFTDLKRRHGLNLVATNNSWGGGGFSQGLYDAIARANAANILFVAAAGNSSTSALSYPAGYDLPNVIAVASLDSNGGLSSFSNFSSAWVDLAAPGGGIYSTLPGNSYGTYSGTSMAAPHVSGALALMASALPTASMAQLKQALLESVLPTASLAGKTASGGRLDVNGAISRLSALVNPDPTAPSYAVNGPASVNEGASLSLTLNSTNVAQGTALHWKITGTGISSTDFVALAALQGSFVVDAAGAAQFQTNLAADLTSEGDETLRFEVYSDASLTTKVAGSTVLLNDTSKPAGVMLWGSTSNDQITGSVGPDQLAGVRSTGTTAADLGAGQIDTLTGLADKDLFLVGDSRGVFYDDRINNNLGSVDYALIKDFTPGIDKLQVKGGNAYLYTLSSSGLMFYWDRNRNGSLTSSGKNQDELIAVLPGLSALGNSDLIAV
jgi:subtilisin family serine protease